MAVLGTDQDPNDPNGANSNGGGAFVGSGTGVGATTKLSTPAATHSGSFTNLDQYLKANQGNATTTAQGVQGVLNSAADTANQAQNAYQQSATNDINQGGQSAKVDQGVLTSIGSATPQYDQGMGQKIRSGEANYTQQQYQGPNYAGASYTGPKDPTGFSGQTGQNQNIANQATDTAKTMGNQAVNNGFSGLSSVLRNAYAQPQYSHGENSLDTFLVGGTPEARNAVQQGASNALGTQGNLDNINTGLQNQIGSYTDMAKATNDQYSKAIQDAQNQVTNVNNQYGSDVAANQQRLAVQAAALKKIQDDQAAATAQAAAEKAAAQRAAALPAPAPKPVQALAAPKPVLTGTQAGSPAAASFAGNAMGQAKNQIGQAFGNVTNQVKNAYNQVPKDGSKVGQAFGNIVNELNNNMAQYAVPAAYTNSVSSGVANVGNKIKKLF